MLAEVIERSAFDTVGSLSKIDTVQVHIKNLIFGIAFFQLFSNKSFFYLAGNGTLLGEKSVFGQLLGNSTATLHLAAAQVCP